MELIDRNMSSQEAVIDLINRTNGTLLSTADILIANTRLNGINEPIADTPWVRETTSDVLAVKGGRIKNNTTITYHRWNANEIFSQVITVIPPKGQTSTIDLITDINALYELKLQVSDIVPQAINLRTLPFNCEITFKTDNPAWMGTIPVVIRKVPYRLDKYLVNNFIPMLQYPTGQTAKIQGPLYCYAFDFTPFAKAFVNYNVATPADYFIAPLNSVLPDDNWGVRPTSSDFNLLGSRLIYNGILIPQYSTRNGFNRIIVLDLGDMCSNVAGYLVFHYNVIIPGS